MKISELIGLEIKEIRFSYTRENEYGMQEFHTYLKVSNEMIIEIPQFFDLELKVNSELTRAFQKAKKPSLNCKRQIENQKIIDVHFCFYQQEIDEERKAFIELENGIYFSEENYGPQGLTNVDLKIVTKNQFEKLKNELELGFEIKSFSTDL